MAYRGWRERRCRARPLWQPRIGFSPPVWPPTAPASWSARGRAVRTSLLAYQPCSQACRVAVATGRSSFAVATELADYRGVEASRGGLPLPRAASAQAGRHGRPAGQHRWRRSWRAQWASIPAGLRARGSRCRWLTVAGVNAAAAHGLCGNRELASARRYGHPLRQRVGQRGAGQSGLPCWRTNLVRKPVGWLWRQAGAHSRLPQSAFVEVALMQGSRRAHQFNREHAGQAPRTPGGPAQVDP